MKREIEWNAIIELGVRPMSLKYGRDTIVEVDLNAVKHNVKEFKKAAATNSGLTPSKKRTLWIVSVLTAFT